ncbi:MAG: ribonuclease P protein component 2 [Candidatus Aenigmarchaeota archaeon]|nr:ribonuclease P protein component 2 [Candidatus Aenigmarchaeota archaeon]
MKQQEKLKILSPTLREKERYISFKIISEESVVYSDLESAIWSQLLDFYGELGVSQMSLRIVKNLYNEKEQIAVIKCNNKSVPKVIGGLGLITRLGESRVIFKILKVSGTIKSLNLK